jgi:hypothetical protein
VSDLQCPARFLVLGPADPAATTSVTPLEARLEALLGRLRGENVAAVYVGSEAPAGATGAVLAAALGVSATPVDGLKGGDPMADPVRTALDDLADRHRGETALVTAVDGSLAPADVLSVEIDADGWRVTRPWPDGSEQAGPDVVDAL